VTKITCVSQTDFFIGPSGNNHPGIKTQCSCMMGPKRDKQS
jgi:hypothetical protein